MSNKAVELKKENYTIQVKYSDEAVEKKLIKFISKSGDEFEMTSEELISLLVNQVNLDTLSPTFVETNKINVVEVSRQLEVELTEDLPKGTKVRLNYVHPYPIEFALIEEAYKIAKIDMSVPRVEITGEYLEEVKAKIKPEMETYVKKFYESFKNLKVS